MRSGGVSVGVGFFVVAAIVACQGESSFVLAPVDAGLPDARYESVCAAWARSRCPCPDSFEWVDDAQCLARETIRCESLAEDPDVPFDAAQVASCRESDAGSCFAGSDEFCLGPGRAQLGASCLRDAACASGYCAQSYDPTTGAASPCGTCKVFACAGGCPVAQYCLIEPDGTAMCVPIVGLPGDPCSGPNDCDSASYCAPTGKCTALPTLGEACGPPPMGLPCGAPDEYCELGDAGTYQCKQYKPQPAGYGAPCGIIGSIEYVCDGYGSCNPTEGICLPPASDGSLCDDNQSLGCLPPARCIGNRCLFPSRALCAGAP